MQEELKVALLFLEALENQSTHVRVSRGYGAGHPHFGGEAPRPLGNRTGLGKSDYEVEEDEPQEEEGQVKVSKAFKEYE